MPISIVLQRLCACAQQFESNVIACLSTTPVRYDQVGRLAPRFQFFISKASPNEVSKVGQLHDQTRYQTSDVLLARHMDIWFTKPLSPYFQPCSLSWWVCVWVCNLYVLHAVELKCLHLASKSYRVVHRCCRACVCVSACCRRCKQKYHKHLVYNHSLVLRLCKPFYRISS